ncbi:helix-turn-helix domain-containing protein [Cryobacterium sp. Y11]|uniref:helix-turn-helix domain-containing protein n=1 Tax=Cryobacterium sp. Y11 TaxID=2045016 RepID=UPI000CE3A442
MCTLPANWLNEHAVASKTGINVETLRVWRRTKKHIPFSKIGRLVRYDEGTVDAYMKSQEVAVAA